MYSETSGFHRTMRVMSKFTLFFIVCYCSLHLLEAKKNKTECRTGRYCGENSFCCNQYTCCPQGSFCCFKFSYGKCCNLLTNDMTPRLRPRKLSSRNSRFVYLV